MKKLKSLLILGCMPLIFIISSCHGGNEETPKSALDTSSSAAKFDYEDFAKKAFSNNLMEIEMAQEVIYNTKDDHVKILAQRLKLNAHQANEALQEVALGNQWTMPEKMYPENKEEVKKIRNLEGDELNNFYLRYMAEDHQKEIKQFQNVLDMAKTYAGMNTTDTSNSKSAAPEKYNRSVTTWVKSTLPMLKDDLQKIEDAQ